MNYSVWAWASWLMGHKADLPEMIRFGEILAARDSSGEQRLDAVIGICNIAKRLLADAPVNLFSAADEGDDADPSEVAALEAEAEQYGCGVITLMVVAHLLKKIFDSRAQ